MRIHIALFAAASLLTVSACKEAPPSNAMFDDGNNANDVPPPVALNQAYTAPEVPPVNVTDTLPVAPPPAFTDKQQINDDADASGMTARLPSDAAEGAANEMQPAQE
jgi:hypothetical protein